MDEKAKEAQEERKRFCEMHGGPAESEKKIGRWQDRIAGYGRNQDGPSSYDEGPLWQALWQEKTAHENASEENEGHEESRRWRRSPYGHPGYRYRDAYNNAQYGYWNDQDEPHSDNAAVGGMIFGILSIVLCWTVFGLVFGIVAVVLSLVARSARERRGYWIAGLVTGIVGLVLFLLVLFLVVTALPPVLEWLIRVYGENGGNGGFSGGFPRQ